MSFLPGSDRQQTHFLPPALEDYVGPDNAVRFLDAFVAKLDLAKADFVFPKENAQGCGRPAYHPADLLKLYLYGYLNQLRSSRRLEAECHRNLEVIWLMRELKPDHKTIADFRKNNAPAFKVVVREFTRLCRQLDLFGGQLLAVDGSRFKASNAPAHNWTGPRLERELTRVEARIDEYLQALEQSDTAHESSGAAALNVSDLQEKIARLQQHKLQIQQCAQTLTESGETQISGTDVDARAMRAPGGGYVIGYNVQAAVDAKHHLLIEAEATNTVVDQGQLARVVRAAKETLDIQRADVVADAGYYKAQDIQQCQQMGVEAHVCTPRYERVRPGLYDKTAFTYDAARDCYLCPAGVQLKRRSQIKDKGRLLQTYANYQACANCALKPKCTRHAGRMISRWEHEAVVERMERAKAAEPHKLGRRRELIEHCWATLKMILAGGFIVRGLGKVKAEINLAHFAYNLKRALAVKGTKALLAALD